MTLFIRPYGTGYEMCVIPPLKRRAIGKRASGTLGSRRVRAGGTTANSPPVSPVGARRDD